MRQSGGNASFDFEAQNVALTYEHNPTEIIPYSGKVWGFVHEDDSHILCLLSTVSCFPLYYKTTEHTPTKIWSTLQSLLQMNSPGQKDKNPCATHWFLIGSEVCAACPGFHCNFTHLGQDHFQISYAPPSLTWPLPCSQDLILLFGSLEWNVAWQKERFSKYVVCFLEFICDNYFHWFFFSINLINPGVCFFNRLQRRDFSFCSGRPLLTTQSMCLK